MTKSVSQALRWARVRRRGYGGLCLKFARQAYGIPAKYSSAYKAWKGCSTKHYDHWSKAPSGSFIFFAPKGSPYGHVAIKNGRSRMYTTDSSRSTTQNARIQGWINYGWKYLGWSWEVNGHTVTGKGSSRPKHVANGKLEVDGYLGPKTIKAWQKFQGTKQDGVISKPSSLIADVQASLNRQHNWNLDVDGYLGPNTIKALQIHYGTPVDGKTSKPSAWVAALQRRLNK